MKRTHKPVSNKAQHAAMLELRRSSAAQPHANKSKYKRKPKHVGRGWDNE